MAKGQKIETFLNIIFGLASLLGLFVSIAFTWVAYKNQSNVSFQEVIITLGISICILTIVFVFVTFYYLKKLSALNNLNVEINATIEKNKHNEILLKNTAEMIYNLSYYQRHIVNKMDHLLDRLETSTEQDVKKISSDLGKFLATFSSNLQTYFTLLTRDSCAITIKIVKEGKVKTFYRDAISYRFRKESDKTLDGKDFIYDISQNFGFHVIYSKDYRESYYFCDDLKNDSHYTNTNPHWSKTYNAASIAPISISIGKSKTELLGFLCVDNFNGNLGQKLVEGILNAGGAMLFPVFYKFEKIAIFANQKKYSDDRVEYFNNWGNS